MGFRAGLWRLGDFGWGWVWVWAVTSFARDRIIHNEKQIGARALLDSGAEGLYCNTKFIQKHQLPLEPLTMPVYPRNVDGSLNKEGAIHHAAILRMEMGDKHQELAECLVTDIGDNDLLLGTDWLRVHNPSINRSTNHLALDQCPPCCFKANNGTPCIAHLLPTFEWEPQIDDDLDRYGDSIEASQRLMAHLETFDPHICFLNDQELLLIARTTVPRLPKRSKFQPQKSPQNFASIPKSFPMRKPKDYPNTNPGIIPLISSQERRCKRPLYIDLPLKKR